MASGSSDRRPLRTSPRPRATGSAPETRAIPATRQARATPEVRAPSQAKGSGPMTYRLGWMWTASGSPVRETALPDRPRCSLRTAPARPGVGAGRPEPRRREPQAKPPPPRAGDRARCAAVRPAPPPSRTAPARPAERAAAPPSAARQRAWPSVPPPARDQASPSPVGSRGMTTLWVGEVGSSPRQAGPSRRASSSRACARRAPTVRSDTPSKRAISRLL